MTQIDELLRQTAHAVEHDDEAERRAIGRAQRALSAAIAAEAAQDQPRANSHRRWGTRLPRRATGLGLAVAGAAAAVIALVSLEQHLELFGVAKRATDQHRVAGGSCSH